MEKIISTIILIFLLVKLAIPQDTKWNSRSITKDTSVVHFSKTWRLKNDFIDIVPEKLDTSFLYFHIFNPIYQNSISNTYLGNLGSPSLSNLFFNRIYKSDFIFFQPFDAYWSAASDQRYFNTTTPYTELDFTQAGTKKNAEHKINLIHSQNINPFWNFYFAYDLFSAIGAYSSQRVRNRTLRISSSFIKKKYKGHLYVGWSKFKHEENGGVRDENDIINLTNNGQTNINRPENIPVRFNDVVTQFKTTNILLNQRWAIDKGSIIINDSSQLENSFNRKYVLFVGHIFELEKNKRFQLGESEPTRYLFDKVKAPDGIYKNLFRPNFKKTFDSIGYKEINNTLFIEFLDNNIQNINFKGKLFTSYQQQEYLSLSPSAERIFDTTGIVLRSIPDTTYLTRYKHSYSAGLNFNTGLSSQIEVIGYANFFLSGYYKGNANLSAETIYRFSGKKDTSTITAKISYFKEIPNYFTEKFFSTYYKWDTIFNTTQRNILTVGFTKPHWQLNINGDYSILSNYIYFGYDAQPKQMNSNISVLSISVQKLFQLWNIYFKNKIVYQQTDKPEIIPLPHVSYYGALYFQNVLFNNVVPFQLGIETFYNTSFYASKYNPALGIFHLQNERKYGNYPSVNIFVNFRLKRAKIFFLYDHILEKYLSRDFFTTPNYPMQPEKFKFGVSWIFFN